MRNKCFLPWVRARAWATAPRAYKESEVKKARVVLSARAAKPGRARLLVHRRGTPRAKERLGAQGKGKAKGKGFQGSCWTCGEFGHSQSNCPQWKGAGAMNTDKVEYDEDEER